MSFNQVLAQGTVVRSHEATVSIDNHSAVLENSSVVGTSTHPVSIGHRTVFGHRCLVIAARQASAAVRAAPRAPTE